MDRESISGNASVSIAEKQALFCGKRGEARLLVRTVWEQEADSVLALQQRVLSNMPDSGMLVGLERENLLLCLREEVSMGIFDGRRLVAFSVLLCNREADWNLGQKMGFPPLECATFDIQFVDPDYRGMGMQAYMLREQEKLALDMGAKYGFATVAPGNSHSLNSFEGCGFSVFSRQRLYGGRDRYVMKKELKRAEQRPAQENK